MAVKRVTVTSWLTWETRMSLHGLQWPSMEITETAQEVGEVPPGIEDPPQICHLHQDQHHQPKIRKAKKIERANQALLAEVASPLHQMVTHQMENLLLLECLGTLRGFQLGLAVRERPTSGPLDMLTKMAYLGDSPVLFLHGPLW